MGEVARTRTELVARVPVRALATVPSVVLAVFVDFGLLVWALVVSARRRRVVRGVLRLHEVETGADDSAGVGLRAWTEALATYSPNAYVIEIERERSLVLLHDLLSRRSSEKPT